MKKRAAWLIVAVAILGLMSIQVASAANELVNGGFETGDFTGWSAPACRNGQGHWTVTTTYPHWGTYDAHGDAVCQQAYPLTQTISWGGGDLVLGTYAFNVLGNPELCIDSTCQIFGTSGNWQWRQVTFANAPAGNHTAELFWAYANGDGNYDDVCMGSPSDCPPATPTPTFTNTATPTMTNTPTNTPTATGFPTRTPFPSLTALPTRTGIPSLTPLPVPGVWYAFNTKTREPGATSVPGNGPIDTSGIALTFAQIGNQTTILMLMPWLLGALAVVLSVAIVVELTIGLKAAYYVLFVGEDPGDDDKGAE